MRSWLLRSYWSSIKEKILLSQTPTFNDKDRIWELNEEFFQALHTTQVFKFQHHRPCYNYYTLLSLLFSEMSWRLDIASKTQRSPLLFLAYNLAPLQKSLLLVCDRRTQQIYSKNFASRFIITKHFILRKSDKIVKIGTMVLLTSSNHFCNFVASSIK